MLNRRYRYKKVAATTGERSFLKGRKRYVNVYTLQCRKLL